MLVFRRGWLQNNDCAVFGRTGVGPEWWEMYPVTFQGWLRLRIALASFLAGSISHPAVYVLGLYNEWYSQVPIVLMAGGIGLPVHCWRVGARLVEETKIS